MMNEIVKYEPIILWKLVFTPQVQENTQMKCSTILSTKMNSDNHQRLFIVVVFLIFDQY